MVTAQTSNLLNPILCITGTRENEYKNNVYTFKLKQSGYNSRRFFGFRHDAAHLSLSHLLIIYRSDREKKP